MRLRAKGKDDLRKSSKNDKKLKTKKQKQKLARLNLPRTLSDSDLGS